MLRTRTAVMIAIAAGVAVTLLLAFDVADPLELPARDLVLRRLPQRAAPRHHIAPAFAISERRNPPRVILMTARGTIETTALAQRIGAFDYIAKPFDLGELIARVRAALGDRVANEVAIEPGPASRIVGSHPSMIAMYKAIARVASLNVPVVILGESGSGKELVAQSIHDLGDRAAGPFIAINCGAIPDTLLENELFGSARGAFTDSRQDRRGALSRADGGTLFLDEIGDISPAFQVKLLRFLQDGVVTPLGAGKSHRVDVRLITATHRDIKRLVAEGKFREDLYYRMAGYEIAVPPLRDRVSDIPLLVDHFKRRIGTEMKKESVAGPSQSVLDVFAAHTWPGNVRELEQVIRRTVIDSGALADPAAALRALRDIAPTSDPRPASAATAEPQDDLVFLDLVDRVSSSQLFFRRYRPRRLRWWAVKPPKGGFRFLCARTSTSTASISSTARSSKRRSSG